MKKSIRSGDTGKNSKPDQLNSLHTERMAQEPPKFGSESNPSSFNQAQLQRRYEIQPNPSFMDFEKFQGVTPKNVNADLKMVQQWNEYGSKSP